MKTAIELIQEELAKKINSGNNPAIEDDCESGELAEAAMVYCRFHSFMACDTPFSGAVELTNDDHMWPRRLGAFAPSENSLENLATAGAFIIAEIERIQRLA